MQAVNLQKTALFLDFDGTLVDFAETPESVEVSDDLRSLLKALNNDTAGAVAVISGRSLVSLDGLLGLPEISAAGGHGAEWRLGGGEIQHAEAIDVEALAEVRAKLAPVAAEHGLLLEDKKHSLALHFRARPEMKAWVDNFIGVHVRPLPGIRVINGNCVREVQVRGIDKGLAVSRFMRFNPFSGRVPCYIGDDTTDEDAFAWVNGKSGISIKVGPGATLAKHRLADVKDAHQFLQRTLIGGN